MTPPASSMNVKSLYPFNWPAIPFHKGEVAVQKRVGTHEHVMSYAPRMVRPYMPDQHRAFLVAQPFLVIAARDDHGRMWSTLLAAKGGPDTVMTTSPNPKTLLLNARPVAGDALEGMLTPGTDVGIIGIEFATKRRNRVNGRIVGTTAEDDKLVFQVDQSFGNCPQYIKPRQWWIAADKNNTTKNNDDICPSPDKPSRRPDHLSEEQMARIRAAETIFLASGYRGEGNDDDPRYGNDASHRGGQAGFVNVLDPKTLILPDYPGNQHFNTIGNLEMDPRMGITFPTYETGAMLQVTGRAKVVEFNQSNSVLAAFYPGAERLIEIHIDQVVDVPEGSIPIRWSTDTSELLERKLVVSAKIQESDDVMSFHLRPQENELQSLWKFQPGQHLPVNLFLDPFQQHTPLERTYTISAGPDWGEYRISVKRQGKASSFLHDHVSIGDTLLVQKPAGDFILDQSSKDLERPIVLLSNGIGVTPMISMLHHWANTEKHKRRPVFFVHGARDGDHHPFVNEVEEIKSLVSNSLTTYVAYSQPLEGDTYDSKGRLTVEKLTTIVPNLLHADIYMCGNDAFLADMEEGLKVAGVPAVQIHYETFS